MRSQNVVADDGGIKEFTARLAGGIQIGIDSESDRDGIQALAALDTIGDTVAPNNEDPNMPTTTKDAGRGTSPQTRLAVALELRRF